MTCSCMKSNHISITVGSRYRSNLVEESLSEYNEVNDEEVE